ncbi:MAG TPA: proton-conducting transporter membrane subunit [Thermoanaerobaculia bacterium]|nr:proton-conducting transporter membrane subunit [Thermoanaerobaculia bacterium]
MITTGGSPAALQALLLLASAAGALAVSGVPGLFLARRSRWGERVATAVTVAACVVGLVAGLSLLAAGGGEARIVLGSALPGVRSELGVDALTAWFVVPVLVVGALASIYSLTYWPGHRQPRNGRRLRLCFGLLLASLVAILLARDGVSFLVAWEVMALTNFFAVTTEEQRVAARRAGWLYLLYSHATILALFAFFTLQQQVAGSSSFAVLPAAMASPAGAALFALATVAFGIKAGVMPLHSWLPAAHAAAPSHVSALMSGVVIKMGVYGLVRATGALAEPPLAWGVAVLVLGAVAAFFGVLFALAQHDLKRLLAFHSIENVGIILLGLGLALVGRSTGRPEWVLLGMAGCLLHVWNHALFKSLLFLGAGSVVHATGSRDLEQMGGLARRMPATTALFLAGAIAICGLPPGNGFVSELLVYLGLARAAIEPGAAWAALSAPVLAATGALALACFVKVLGVVFLGSPRSQAAQAAHEAPAGMLAPMAALAGLCALLGSAPALVAPALERATVVWAGGVLAAQPLAALVPFRWVSWGALALVAGVGLLLLLLRPVCRRARVRQPELPTWDCGYAASSPRLQYTGSSFAELVTSRFAWALRPHEQRPAIEGHFPQSASFHSQVDDTVLDRLLAPAARTALAASAWFRSLPQGQLQRYILYVVAVVVPLLAWALAGGGGDR